MNRQVELCVVEPIESLGVDLMGRDGVRAVGMRGGGVYCVWLRGRGSVCVFLSCQVTLTSQA
jgi:hypothetical protein